MASYEEKRPVLKIGPNSYKASVPKVKAWHDFMEFETSIEDLPTVEYMDRMAELVASLFPNTTADVIMNNVDLPDMKPLYNKCRDWIVYLVNVEIDKIPKNGEPGERT